MEIIVDYPLEFGVFFIMLSFVLFVIALPRCAFLVVKIFDLDSSSGFIKKMAVGYTSYVFAVWCIVIALLAIIFAIVGILLVFFVYF